MAGKGTIKILVYRDRVAGEKVVKEEWSELTWNGAVFVDDDGEKYSLNTSLKKVIGWEMMQREGWV